jgi:hypothetical protein
VDRFKAELRSLFSSFQHGDANRLAFFPPELRFPIMQAGRSQTLLRMTYEGVQRLAEPHSLVFKWRKGGIGQEYLYVYDQTGGRSGPSVKNLFNWKITSLEINRHQVRAPHRDRTSERAGEYGERTTFSFSRRASVLRPTRTRTRPLPGALRLPSARIRPGHHIHRDAPASGQLQKPVPRATGLTRRHERAVTGSLTNGS